MQAYFEGRRELFEGLAIDKMETAWQRHPVIRLDMSTVKGGDYATIMATIDRMLRGLEARFGSDDRDATPGSRLQTLIDRAVAQTGKQAVVLVDEYDAPMLEVVDKPDELRRVCETMRELYIPLKARDADLRFVFLTGITKFSQLSIFSELNNLRNISMLADYAAICGITDDELHQQMAPDVNALAERLGITPSEAFSQLKAQFDGYHFCAESPDIYNPFSLLTALANGKIDSWWFGNGTPAGLLRLITGRNLDVADLTGVRAAESDFDAPAEQLDNTVALLYQSGYLTIKGYDRASELYELDVPNREVALGLNESLIGRCGRDAAVDYRSFRALFTNCFKAGDADGALTLLKSYLAGVPYDLSAKNEKAFQAALWHVFTLSDLSVSSEVRIAHGRIDAVVRVPGAQRSAQGIDTHDTSAGTIYVMEFKYNKSASEALSQIDAKDYTLPYTGFPGRTVKVGVSFDPEKRTIGDWVIAEA